MKRIKLTQGKIALVDDADYKFLSQWKWCATRHGHMFYATRGVHRLVIGASEGEFVDHINQDGLDNRKQNLRTCTAAQNAQNRKVRKTSKYKGITWHKGCQKWQAMIGVNGKAIYLGLFPTPEDTEAATKYHGQYMCVAR